MTATIPQAGGDVAADEPDGEVGRLRQTGGLVAGYYGAMPSHRRRRPMGPSEEPYASTGSRSAHGSLRGWDAQGELTEYFHFHSCRSPTTPSVSRLPWRSNCQELEATSHKTAIHQNSLRLGRSGEMGSQALLTAFSHLSRICSCH